MPDLDDEHQVGRLDGENDARSAGNVATVGFVAGDVLLAGMSGLSMTGRS
jgi:hypothetical protein